MSKTTELFVPFALIDSDCVEYETRSVVQYPIKSFVFLVSGIPWQVYKKSHKGYSVSHCSLRQVQIHLSDNDQSGFEVNIFHLNELFLFLAFSHVIPLPKSLHCLPVPP